MSESARLVPHGVSGSTPINADVTNLGSAVPVKVTLTANGIMHLTKWPLGIDISQEPRGLSSRALKCWIRSAHFCASYGPNGPVA